MAMLCKSCRKYRKPKAGGKKKATKCKYGKVKSGPRKGKCKKKRTKRKK